MRWHDYVDDEHPQVRELEGWLGSLVEWARNAELGRIDDLLEAASRGELEDSGDARTPIKPIHRDPEIFELRHRALSKQLRFYHGEPPEFSTTLVALHRHIKDDGSRQEDQIRHAAARYVAGRATLWDIQ